MHQVTYLIIVEYNKLCINKCKHNYNHIFTKKNYIFDIPIYIYAVELVLCGVSVDVGNCLLAVLDMLHIYCHVIYIIFHMRCDL